MSRECFSLNASVRLGSVRDFITAFLIITENGIEDIDDAEYTIQRIGENISPYLWAGARHAIGERDGRGDGAGVVRGEGIEEESSIGDFYPVVAYIWAMHHWGEQVPPLTGQYTARDNTDSTAEFDADNLEIKIANFGIERSKKTVIDLIALLAAGEVRYLTQDIYSVE